MNKPVQGWRHSKTLEAVVNKDGRLKEYWCESENGHYVELNYGFATDEGCITFREDTVKDMLLKIRKEICQQPTII